MTTNKQRREAERVRLQRQLDERRQREAARKQFTLIASVVGTLVVIAAVIVVIAVVSGGSGNNTATKTGAASSPAHQSATPSPSGSPAASGPPLAAPAACAKPSTAKTVEFQGVSVLNPTDLKKDPKARAQSATLPRSLLCDDLVAGTGKAASKNSSVTVQYSGLLYKDGTLFDSSWSRGQPATFPLKSGPGGVIDGFVTGIAGGGKVAPMHVGGRRIIIMPPALGYGSSAQGSIPANAALVFVVDLLKVTG